MSDNNIKKFHPRNLRKRTNSTKSSQPTKVSHNSDYDPIDNSSIYKEEKHITLNSRFKKGGFLDKISRYMGLGLGGNLGLHPFIYILSFMVVAMVINSLFGLVLSLSGINLNTSSVAINLLIYIATAILVIFPLSTRSLYYIVNLYRKFKQ